MSGFYADPEYRTARAAHECDPCQRTIDPGEKYRSQFGVYDGSGYRFKQCAHCEKVWSIWEPQDMDAQISQGGYDDWQVNAYGTSVSELRAIICFRRQCRRKDGSLYPLPTLPVGATTSGPDPTPSTARETRS